MNAALKSALKANGRFRLEHLFPVDARTLFLWRETVKPFEEETGARLKHKNLTGGVLLVIRHWQLLHIQKTGKGDRECSENRLVRPRYCCW